MDVRDHRAERHVVAVVPVDAVQTRGTACLVVGLRLDDEPETRLGGPRGRTSALVLGASQGE
jgi:hypothetical protein